MLFCRLATIYLLSDRMLLQKGINSSSFNFALALPVEKDLGSRRLRRFWNTSRVYRNFR